MCEFAAVRVCDMLHTPHLRRRRLSIALLAQLLAIGVIDDGYMMLSGIDVFVNNYYPLCDDVKHRASFRLDM